MTLLALAVGGRGLVPPDEAVVAADDEGLLRGRAAFETLRVYGGLCAATLARAHARTGDSIAIAAYLGRADVFDRALLEFSSAYAEQNDRDYRTLAAAVDSGRITAER